MAAMTVKQPSGVYIETSSASRREKNVSKSGIGGKRHGEISSDAPLIVSVAYQRGGVISSALLPRNIKAALSRQTAITP